MAYYYHRQCVQVGDMLAIPPGHNINFEKQCDCSQRDDETDDFNYDYERDLIEVTDPGLYLILWTVRQQTGLPADGQTFQLLQEEPDQLAEDPNELKQTWYELAGASTQLKIANSTGVGSIYKLNKTASIRFALQNVSKDTVILAPTSPIKAEIFIYGIGDFNGDMELLQFRLNDLAALWQGDVPNFDEMISRLENITNNISNQNIEIDKLANDLTNTYNELVSLITPSGYFKESAKGDGGIPGMDMVCRRSEHTYMFWSEGVYTGGAFTVTDDRVYLWKSIGDADLDPVTEEKNPWRALGWYQGAATIAPGWLYSGSTSKIIAIYADHTGIYFYLDDLSELTVGGYYRFTLSLMLDKEG